MRTRTSRPAGLPLALLLAGAVGCSDPNPQGPLDEEDLEILTHVMLIEASLQDFTLARKDSLSTAYYTQLYDRFGITAEDLSDLRTRFSDDPSLWERAGDSLVARLERHRGDPGALLNLPEN